MAQKAPQTRATPTVAHVDPQAVADIQQAMQADLMWRRHGRQSRVHFGVTFDSPRSLERLASLTQTSVE